MKEKNAVKIIISLLAVIGLLTAIVVAVDALYKKYRRTLHSLNEQDTLEGLDEKCFNDEEDEDGIDCDFAE